MNEETEYEWVNEETLTAVCGGDWKQSLPLSPYDPTSRRVLVSKCFAALLNHLYENYTVYEGESISVVKLRNLHAMIEQGSSAEQQQLMAALALGAEFEDAFELVFFTSPPADA